ncbi:hypothetical protein [Streptomyces silvensis]|uniref:Uncharacterized protein n=1 Tax=Streptomyces silvensis TaxID=1765722 RepID=A0A0W7X6S7_9ACTN|nr:hypothetical protein [Streptomyces silvensis]KUF18443.1 hypothetical protein AT728_19040 [Streptomyces silvensis]
MTDYHALSEALLRAADAMHSDMTLDADRALRHAIYGDPDTALDEDPSKAALHLDALTAIAELCTVQPKQVAGLPHGRAQIAARIASSRAAVQAHG